MLGKFRDDLSGGTAVEYGLIVGVLGLGLLLSASKARDMIDGMTGKLLSAGETAVVRPCGAAEICDRNRNDRVERGGAPDQPRGLR